MKIAILRELNKGPRKRRDLRKLLGLEPGKGTKALLKALHELQGEGRVWYSIHDDIWYADEDYVGPPDTYLGRPRLRSRCSLPCRPFRAAHCFSRHRFSRLTFRCGMESIAAIGSTGW